MEDEVVQLCRLCLVKNQADIPIFAEQNERQIFEKIRACLPIMVSKDDNLPKKICASCLDKLDTFYHFWNTTVNAEKQLLTWLERGFLVQTQIHSIKQEELDTLENIPDNRHENFASYPMQSPSDIHFQGLVSFSESQTEFHGVKDEEVQNSNFEKINQNFTPGEIPRPQLVPGLAMAHDKASEEEVYEPPLATVFVKTERDNQTISFKEAGENPQANDILDKKPSNLLEMQIGNEKILNHMPQFFQVPSSGQCHICGKIFLRRGGLKQHMLVHTDEKPISCDICFKGFKNKFTMQDHKKYHGETKPFECDTCNKTFKRKISLQVHQKRHVKDYKFTCEICNRGFYTNVEYKLHLGSKHGQSNNICPICNKALYDKCSLKKHMRLHADDYKDAKYKCELCGKSFLQERYLKNHMNNQHTDGLRRQYVCDLCGKKLCSGTSLRAHQLLHQGIKPHKCHTCGKSFTLRTALTDHLRIHTGDKPYKCEHCNKGFTQRNTYVIHMRYHTGERPYLCRLCDTGFVSRTALNLHLKNKHNLL